MEDSYENGFVEAAGLGRIEAAGGLIVNPSGGVLFIAKGGKWDLPKGRVERGGGYEETALREVVEETSIEKDLIRIANPLCHTWHTTSYGGKIYIKKTVWFVIEYAGKGDNLRPQVEEGITECRWIHPGNFKAYRGGMRPRIDYVTNLWKKVFFEANSHRFPVTDSREREAV